MSEQLVCATCRKPKATLKCGLCQAAVCKGCVQFLDEQAFPYWPELAPELKHTHYCQGCFGETVEPAQARYEELMNEAKEAYIFFSSQKRPPPVLKRALERVSTRGERADRDESILELAFQAAEQGFNAVIEVDVSSEKVRNSGYQSTRWKAQGVPAQVDAEKLERTS